MKQSSDLGNANVYIYCPKSHWIASLAARKDGIFFDEIKDSSGVTSRASFFQKDNKKDKEANDKLAPNTVRKA